LQHLRRGVVIISKLGIVKALQFLVQAKLLKIRKADLILHLASLGVKPLNTNANRYLWRDRLFTVPDTLLPQFVGIISELIVRRVYELKHRSYDVVIDIGGFLGETTWWFLTEGYAKEGNVLSRYTMRFAGVTLEISLQCYLVR
jgi:hypothetical protein